MFSIANICKNRIRCYNIVVCQPCTYGVRGKACIKFILWSANCWTLLRKGCNGVHKILRTSQSRRCQAGRRSLTIWRGSLINFMQLKLVGSDTIICQLAKFQLTLFRSEAHSFQATILYHRLMYLMYSWYVDFFSVHSSVSAMHLPSSTSIVVIYDWERIQKNMHLLQKSIFFALTFQYRFKDQSFCYCARPNVQNINLLGWCNSDRISSLCIVSSAYSSLDLGYW